jgi:hypothetical protein
MRTACLFGPELDVKKSVKYPSPSESARRIRASLDRHNDVPRATTPAIAAPPPLELAASLATPLRQGFSPSHPDDADRSDLGPVPLPFPDQKPQAPLDPLRMEPIFLSTISQGLDSGRSLPSIRVWLVSGAVASLTIFALALPFPLKSNASNRSQAVTFPKPESAPALVSPGSSAIFARLPPNPPLRPAAAFMVQHVSLSVNQAAWISACADGKEMFQIMVSPGDTPDFEFANRAVVRIGNAGGVELAVNGAAIGQLGPEGEVRVLELTHEGFRLLTLPPGATSNDCDLH